MIKILTSYVFSESDFTICIGNTMNNILLILTISLTLIACGGSNKKETAPPPSSPEPITLAQVNDYQLQDTQVLLSQITTQLQGLTIEDFFEQAYLTIVDRNVESAISDGKFDNIDIDTVNLNDISDESVQQVTEIEKLLLQLLETYDRASLSKENRLSYDVYQAHLKNQIEWAQFQNYSFPASYGFFGWPGGSEGFFTRNFTITNKDQAELYLTLLNQLGRRFSQIEKLLETRRVAGIVEPKVTFSYSQSQIAEYASLAITNTSYYQTFHNQVSALSNITTAEKQKFTEKLSLIIQQKVLPAYHALATKMSGMMNESPENIGFGQYQGGKEFYDFSLRFYTSSQLSSDEVHQLGLDELARIHAEMNVLFNQLGYPENESLTELLTRTDIDGGIIAADQSKAFYENIIEQAYALLPTAFSTLPVQEVIVVGGASGGYYVPGSDDGSRPGAFYAGTVNDLPYSTMPTLAYHEAVPGHHLQIALANELDLPLFRRKINVTSFVEGWGLYAERLAFDLGWYEQDLYGNLGRLQYEAMRAARLVIDTGIHDKGWTYDQANQFHIENVGFNGSIARYSVWPGQAAAYMTGMLKILELREQAKQQLGGLYDIKDFHDAVIGQGSMPLYILENVVENYIAEKLAEN